MRSDEANRKLQTRLRRIEGQVGGLLRMLEEDADCVDVMLQLSAVQGALGKVGQLLLDGHMRTCVAEAVESGSPAQRRKKLDELMVVLSRYGGPR